MGLVVPRVGLGVVPGVGVTVGGASPVGFGVGGIMEGEILVGEVDDTRVGRVGPNVDGKGRKVGRLDGVAEDVEDTTLGN